MKEGQYCCNQLVLDQEASNHVLSSMIDVFCWSVVNRIDHAFLMSFRVLKNLDQEPILRLFTKALVHIIMHFGSELQSSKLITAGVDLKYRNESGNLLHNALIYQKIKIAVALIRAGIDMNETDQQGMSPLALALYHRETCFEYTNILLNIGANTNTLKTEFRYAPPHMAVIIGRADILQIYFAFDASIIDTPSKEGMTILMVASYLGRTDLVRFLIANGSNVALYPSKGIFASALHAASEGGHADIIDILIKSGADVDYKDDDDRTAIFFAVVGGHVDAVKTLIANKAGIHVVDKNDNGLAAYVPKGDTRMHKIITKTGGFLSLWQSTPKTHLMSHNASPLHNLVRKNPLSIFGHNNRIGSENQIRRYPDHPSKLGSMQALLAKR